MFAVFKKVLLHGSGRKAIEPADVALNIEGSLTLEEDLRVNGNVTVSGDIVGSGTLYATGSVACSSSIEANVVQNARLDTCDLSVADGTTTFYGDTTCENGAVSVESSETQYGIANTAEFTVYCKLYVNHTCSSNSYGIFNERGTLTVNGEVAITNKGTGSGSGIYTVGIDNSYGTLTVNGKVDITNEGIGSRTYGIYATFYPTYIVNGEINVTNKGTGSGSGCYIEGIDAGRHSTFTVKSGATVTVENTGTDSNYTYGINNSSDTFTIESGATVTVESTGSGSRTCGIYNNNTFTIESGAVVTVETYSYSGYGYGIYNSGTFIFDGVCYMFVEDTSRATYGTLTGSGTLYVNGVETEF